MAEWNDLMKASASLHRLACVEVELGELAEARQLNRRYRDALQRIRERPVPWCEDYALCGHDGCVASHRAFEIATNALEVESSF